MLLTRRRLIRVTTALPVTALLARYPGARLVQAQGAEYDLVDFGAFTGSVTNKFDIDHFATVNSVNDEGLVVGRVVASAQKLSPATWSRTGTLKRIKSGKYGGAIFAVNTTGVLAGIEYLAAALEQRPVLWRDGEKVALPFPTALTPNFEGVATAINDDDVAVGYAFYNHDNTVPDSLSSTLPTALRWTGDEVEILPRPEEATSSRAFAINAAGAIAGSVTLADRSHLAVWEGDELDLYPLPEDLKQVFVFDPRSISADGLVLASGIADNAYQTFVYDRGKPMRLPGLTKGAGAYARGMNDDGTVVGASFPEDESDSVVAAIWRDGDPRDLNALVPSDSGLRLLQGQAISNSGAIAATGLDDEDAVHGVLLLPAS